MTRSPLLFAALSGFCGGEMQKRIMNDTVRGYQRYVTIPPFNYIARDQSSHSNRQIHISEKKSPTTVFFELQQSTKTRLTRMTDSFRSETASEMLSIANWLRLVHCRLQALCWLQACGTKGPDRLRPLFPFPLARVQFAASTLYPWD
jgi:hypothetical protein